MKLIPIAFDSETSPWRVILPTALTHGKRKAKYFATKKEADDFCKIANKPGFSLEGFVPVVPKSKQDEFAIAIRQFVALYDGKIYNAYAAHEKLQKLQNIRPATVREAVEAFQAWRQTQVGIKWGQSTVTQDRYRLVKLIRKFERIPLADLTTVALREFFDETTGDPRSIYSSVHTFFDWAIKRQYLVENPIAPIVAKEVGEYGINNDYYPVETFRRMLLIAAGLEPVKKGGQTTKALRDLLPWFVISGFLGLRSCEARRESREADSIRWSDLHFDAEVPYVEVRASVVKGRMGKLRKSRYIETSHYLEAAKAWLEYYGKPETDGPIVRWTKRQIQELKRDFKKATGLRFTENGFRNSFATYALTFNGLQGIGKLALEMGDSEAVCNRHYVRSIAPGSGRAWFNMRPFEVVEPSLKVAVK